MGEVKRVKLGQVFGPMGLPTCEHLGHGEVLKVLVIHNHIDQGTRAFKEVLPDMESLKDGQQFFVMS